MFDGVFERPFDVADQTRGLEGKREHHGVADAAWKRRDLSVFCGQRGDSGLELFDLRQPSTFFLGAFGGDVSACEAEKVVQVLAELTGEASDGAVGPVGLVLVGAQVVEDEKPHGAVEGRLGREEGETSVETVEHAGTGLGVSEEVDFAIGGDRPSFYLTDVVKQRGPANLEARHGLADHLLGVFPDVLVAPLAVAEADECFDLRKESGHSAASEELVETKLWVEAHDDAVETLADCSAIVFCGGAKGFRGGLQKDADGGSVFGGQRGLFEGVDGVVDGFGGEHRRGRGF